MTPNSLSASSDIDIDALIETDGCSSIFYALETCLAENNRDWRKCQSMKTSLLDLFQDSISILQYAGEAIYTIFHEKTTLEIINKSSNIELQMDPQTIADRTAQQYIVTGLSHHYPQLCIVAEEGELENIPLIDLQHVFLSKVPLPFELETHDIIEEGTTAWIDPLDGTSLFVQGKESHVSILLGFSIRGVPFAGLMYEPFTNVLHFGMVGKGVWRYQKNDVWNMVQVPPSSGTLTSLVVSGKEHDPREVVISALNLQSKNVFRGGATGTMLLRILYEPDCVYLRLRNGTMKWDSCAGEALLRTVGGNVVDMYGEKMEYISNADSYNNACGLVASLSQNYLDRIVYAIESSMSLLRTPLEEKVSRKWIENELLGSILASCDSSGYSIVPGTWIRGRKHSESAQLAVRFATGPSQNFYLKRTAISKLPIREHHKWQLDVFSYRCEMAFYTHMQPILETIPTAKVWYTYQHQVMSSDMVNEQDNFKGEEYILLFEDLTVAWKQLDALEQPATKVALNYLATMHAVGWRNTAVLEVAAAHMWPFGGWWGYDKRGNKELQNALHVWEKFKVRFADDAPEGFFTRDGISTLAKRIVSNAAWINTQLQQDTLLYPTFMHGDFKTANFFFQKNNSNSEEIVLAIDWQWSGIGLGAMDVAYLFVTSIGMNVLEKHEDSLLQYYYTSLADKVAERGGDLRSEYPFTVFMKHFRYSVLEYGKTALSYFWTSCTPSTCRELANDRNRGLAYRSIEHALRLVDVMHSYLQHVEKERDEVVLSNDF